MAQARRYRAAAVPRPLPLPVRPPPAPDPTSKTTLRKVVMQRRRAAHLDEHLQEAHVELTDHMEDEATPAPYLIPLE
eukprot:5240316-Pyramimonas_sp.AAC.1